MNAHVIQEREKTRKERAKQAVALAMKSRWEEAVSLNQSILKDFPDDLEAYNRLGKALSELGRNGEAMAAFRSALKLSPHNTIARKNVERLMRLGEETIQPAARSSAPPQVFIEESGKAGVTSLVNLPSPKVLLKLAPGHAVELHIDGKLLNVTGPSGEYAGRVEPRLASRLVRLMNGGNRYQATVTSASARELSVIIREVYKHPSQSAIVSFPSRVGVTTDYRVYMPSTVLGQEAGGDENGDGVRSDIKDWSDDDTEPGDDEAFTPMFHRIISADGEEAAEEEEEF